VARNLACPCGEIDLLVSVDGLLVAVEVKTRVGGDPADQFTVAKQRAMREAAASLHPRPDRVDLVTVRFDRSGATMRWIRSVL